MRYLTGIDIRRSSALFILKLKEKDRLTEVVIDHVVEGCRGLFSQTIERVQTGVKAEFAESGLDPDKLGEILYFPHVLNCVTRCTLLFPSPQEPKTIDIGQVEYTQRFSGSKRQLVEKYDNYQNVPLLPQLLKDDTVYVKSGVFSLDFFNDRLLNFNYGYSENDKPTPILCSRLNDPNKPLKQSASQMLLLLRILPFLIGERIHEDDEYWVCFIVLRKIVDIVLSPVASESVCSSLKLLIREHHTKFVSLYGVDAYIPKMHFLFNTLSRLNLLVPW